MITFSHKGDFKKTEKFLKKTFGRNYMKILEKYGEIGVQQLKAHTPVDSGVTAISWYYKIEQNTPTSLSLTFYNDNVNNGVNIAVILQYGHGTRNGGWVEGRDYINPALKPVFDSLADAAWKEVLSDG